MSTTDLILSEGILTNGISPASTNVVWGFGPWIVLNQQISRDIAIIALHFQLTYAPIAADTTVPIYEHIFEVGVGQAGHEVTKIQIPYSTRADTNVGIYLDTHSIFLPEPFRVTKNTRLSTRVAASLGTATTFNGVKMLYQVPGAAIVEQKNITPPNNYRFPDSVGLSVTEKCY